MSTDDAATLWVWITLGARSSSSTSGSRWEFLDLVDDASGFARCVVGEAAERGELSEEACDGIDDERVGLLGWFHTYDERLYDGGTLGAPTSTSSSIIHRVGARGRRFTCASGSCTTNDGSLDTLQWVSAGSYFRLTSADKVTTDFYGTGATWKKGALWQKQTTRGAGWEVVYHTTGALTGYIDYVEDHLGRQLDFVWSPAATNGAPAQLITLKDGGGTTLASFEYDLYARLTGATSAAGVEGYDYYVDQSGRTTRLMTAIVVDGQESVSVSYDVALGEGWAGRVATIAEAGASLRLRYRGATRNACTTASQSTMIVDRSTAPVGASSCTDNASGDAWCAGQAGMPAVCDAGLCRAIACQRYGDLVGGAGEDRITAIEGNCPCAGIATMGWVAAGSEAPRRIKWDVSRDGKTTSHAYDTRGREVARCDGDSNTTVTTTASSCPSTGQWSRLQYTHGTFPLMVTIENQRSRLHATQQMTTTLTYDANHAELTQIQVTGYSRDPATDANVSQTLTTTYQYDSSGRLTKEILPAGETTSFTYSTQTGTGYGLLATAERWLSGGATRLITSFSDYTVVGRPGGVTDPSGAGASYVYNFGGMQLSSHARAGETTSYAYDAGGRLEELIEPSGRRTTYTYDARGRTLYEDVRDAQASLASDRAEYTYDAAGRRTKVVRRRLSNQGVPQTIEWQMEATYDERGSMLTSKYGARSAIQYQLDPNGMGRVTGVTREDGDQVSMSYDAFGRELEYRRYITSQSSGAYLSSYSTPGGNEAGEALPTQITDPASVVRDYVYDDFGRLVRSQSNDFGTIRWAYTDGWLTERRMSNGKRSTYSYDELGRVTTINHDADSSGVVGQDYQFVYDNGGYTCGISGSSCTYRKGRLAIAKIEYAAGTFWDLEYDYGAHGRVTAERWPGSRQTNYTYDAQGRLLRTELPVATGDKLRYEYDAVDNDGEDPSELRRVVHELTAGQDYLVWARNLQHDALGRLTRAHLADRADGGNPSLELTHNTDGTQALWRVRRRATSSDVYMMNRTYNYWPDGQAKGWTSSVSADSARTFFWDGANRLTCAASTSGLSSCPTNSTLMESYVYDLNENRTSKATPAGTTTYYNPGNNNQLYDEYPPSHTIWYGYDSNTFGGRTYDVHQSVAASNQRTYYYHPSGGMRSIVMTAPGTTAGTYDSHTYSILYDHLGRPIYIADTNTTTNKERREQLYWNLDGQLLERVTTPDATTNPNTYSVDIFAHLERAATGWMRLEYVNGSFTSETRRYIAQDPAAQVAAVWSFTGVGATASVYTADYQPYGEVRTSSGTIEPALAAGEQIAIVGSDARVWSGQTVTMLRSRLLLARMVLDSRVGAVVSLDESQAMGLQPYAIPPWLRSDVHTLRSSLPSNGHPEIQDWWLPAGGIRRILQTLAWMPGVRTPPPCPPGTISSLHHPSFGDEELWICVNLAAREAYDFCNRSANMGEPMYDGRYALPAPQRASCMLMWFSWYLGGYCEADVLARNSWINDEVAQSHVIASYFFRRQLGGGELSRTQVVSYWTCD